MKFTKSETVGQGLAPAVKKLLSLMLAIVMLFSITVSIDISAYALTSGDYECSVKNGTATITKDNGLESDITIPSDIDGYSVTAIGNYAFKGCWSLENVTIPDSVISIGSGAFSNCSCLISIDIPNSVTSIGNSAFFYCESLNSVTLPKNIKVIKYMMFENCKNLEKVIIPDGVTSIEFDAFDRCTSLTHITIPNSITEIGHSAFYQCENLEEVSIPDGVLCIDNYTFAICRKLKSISIPNSVKRINSKVFAVCDSLSNVYYDGTVTEWNEISFGEGNEELTNSAIFCSDGVLNCKHNFSISEIMKPVTCTVDGTIKYTCEFCNESKTETVLADGHNYDAGKITKKATCTETGTKTFTCTKCKSTKTETLKAIGHKAVTDKAVSATCTTLGKTEGRHCSVCNTVIQEQKTIPATGHGYDAGKVTKQPTVTTAGVKNYTCQVCGETKTETIPALGLKAPTMKATVNANGTFTLSWNKVSGAEKYELYIKQADGSYKLMKTTTATSFTTAFATYNKQFSYKMRAVKGNTKSAYSSVVNAKNTKKLQTPTMKATVNANGTFKLSWNKVTGADKYELYIKQANGSYKLMKTTTATSFTTAYATYNKQFSYKMRAINSKNKSIASAYSAVVSAKNTKKLQAPTMKATVNKNGTFKLSWNKVDGATSYKLYIKQANGSYKLMKTTSATSFTTAVATKGKTYSYKMVAVTSKNKNATSAYSNVVSAKRK